MWRAPFGATRACQLWLLDRSSACRESALLFSGSPADPPLLPMLELLKYNCRFSGRSFAGSHRSISFRSCIIARLPDYPVGMVWESSGVIKGLSSSIGNQNSPREPGGRVFEVFTESPTLSAAWETGLNASPDDRLTDAGRLTADQRPQRNLTHKDAQNLTPKKSCG
jgi:hypothetical protein